MHCHYNITTQIHQRNVCLFAKMPPTLSISERAERDPPLSETNPPTPINKNFTIALILRKRGSNFPRLHFLRYHVRKGGLDIVCWKERRGGGEGNERAAVPPETLPID